MSAPVTERARAARGATRTRPATIPAQRGAPVAAPQAWEDVPAPRKGSQQSAQTQKAYARKDDRARRLVAGRPARTGAPAGRAQFVLLIMVLLAVGLVATLWLSTAAAADSYRLQDARAEARTLSEQSERLRREVTTMESAPELARRAGEFGMVPVQDSARLVVAPDGSVAVVGSPHAVAPAPRPAPPAPEPTAAPPAVQGPADPAASADTAATADGATPPAGGQEVPAGAPDSDSGVAAGAGNATGSGTD